MSCGPKDKKFDNCVCEVVRAIKDIQDNAVEDECLDCTTNCFLEPLGGLNSPVRRHKADTRVFTLSLPNGELFKGLFRRRLDDHPCVGGFSPFFRVEEVFDNCCATLRVLVPVGDYDHDGDLEVAKDFCKIDGFVRTDNCITVDLDCFCAVQCIADVNLRICD
ncbi:CotZ [Bacillus coahuilensis m2-6]|uniref:CotZ n=1 Tax=Bacillus coahuilensis p1.1.43 TaxID=1150625 RepID=A0A147KA22_9BACI|nr:CotY/CotZ family spore coat protein [Bacillus coahuilensis]KUP07544.1 CotZ [Bacillus coahuilensis p1.1.43]KUP09007.1 CotZ [Bacillus coahuilensis m2-6]